MLSRRALVTGILTALAVVVPAVIAEVVLVPDPNVQVLLYALLLAGLVLGGYRAGRRAGGAPMTNGALAGLAAFVLLEAGVVAVGQVNGRPFPAVPPLIFNAFMAACAGIFGGFLASLRRPADPPSASDAGEVPTPR